VYSWVLPLVRIHVTDRDLDEATDRVIRALKDIGLKLTEDDERRIREITEKVKRNKVDALRAIEEFKSVVLEIISRQ